MADRLTRRLLKSPKIPFLVRPFTRDTPYAMPENLELVRAVLSAFERADYEAALEALDPDVEWQVPPGIAIGREVWRGRDEVWHGFAQWLEAWDTYRFEPEEILDHREHVVIGGAQIGRGRNSGAQVRHPTFHVFTLRDGKITCHRSYRDRTEALEAAGLRESAMSRETVDAVRRDYTASAPDRSLLEWDKQ